jgi:hypothetical protein
MEKNKKLLSHESMQETEGDGAATDVPLLNSDLSTMRDVLLQFRDEMDNDENELSIIFHVSILWTSTDANPGIMVSIKLKDLEEDEEVASWDRLMHKADSKGWELTLGKILQSAREMQIDYMIMQNSESFQPHNGWLQ